MVLRDFWAGSGCRVAGSKAAAPVARGRSNPLSTSARSAARRTTWKAAPSALTQTLCDAGAPVAFDDPPADPEAQAQARAPFGAVGFTLCEGLEDLVQLRRLEAATFVREFDREVSCAMFRVRIVR